MKLNDLHSKRRLVIEDEAISYPRRSGINPGIVPTRLPAGTDPVVADRLTPAYNLDETVEQADQMYQDGNARGAYEILKQELQRHHVTGLRQHPKKMQGRYLSVVGDVDNAKWLNDESGLGHTGTNVALQHLGKQITRHVNESDSGLEMFHLHGDEFQGMIDIDGETNPRAVGRRIIDVVKMLLQVSNSFASTPFYPTSADRDNRSREVRATISFAISDSNQKADMILSRTKGYTKYVVVIDTNLVNRYIRIDPMLTRELAQLRTASKVGTATSESKMNKMLEAVMGQPGCLLLELNPLEIPQEEALEIQAKMDKKREYLRRPSGVYPIDCGSQIVYYPLKEPCNSYPL